VNIDHRSVMEYATTYTAGFFPARDDNAKERHRAHAGSEQDKTGRP
jgi:hypothetical protein